MIHRFSLGFLMMASAIAAAGCAIGSVDDPDFGDGGAGGGAVIVTSNNGGAGGTDSSTDASSTTASTGDAQASSSSGSTTCGLTEHMCAGSCAPNTPETGCFKSATCYACSVPTGGTALCSAQGECDYDCTAPNVKDGNGGCVDPNAGTGSGSGGGDDPMCLIMCLMDPASAAGLGCAC